MATLPRMWTLAEVAALLQTTPDAAYHQLRRHRFPIAGVKYGGAWRFTDADVRAYVERRQATNPLLQQKQRYSAGREALLETARQQKAVA